MRTKILTCIFTLLLSLSANADEKVFTREQLRAFTQSCSYDLRDSIYKKVCGKNYLEEGPSLFGTVYLGNDQSISFGLYTYNNMGMGLVISDDSNGLSVWVPNMLCTSVASVPSFSLTLENSASLPHYFYSSSKATPVYDQFGNLREDLEQVRVSDIAFGSDQNLSSATPLINQKTGRYSSVTIDTQKLSDCLHAAIEQ
jgi:hypothetical protein